MTIHTFLFIWLIGSVIVAYDIYNTLYNDQIANYKFNKMNKQQKYRTLVELNIIAFIGSWFIIFWRIFTYLYIKFNQHHRKRR